jgi:dihydroxyacid dehydratase/phosphogluconate dehydratase
VQNGDRIALSVSRRAIDLRVDAAELGRRRQALEPPPPPPTRGYARLYAQHALQADEGCDFDFLREP